MSVTRQHLCLAVLLALGLLHGLAQARLRPLYQVSDELQYIFGAQQAAVSSAATVQDRCISPPDGSLLEAGNGGGKWAFQAATASQLSWACRDGGPFPLFLLRVFSALSLPVLIWSTWVLARTIWPGSVDVALLAGLLVATHPVLVKYGSGVTPDAWTNAFAGVAFMTGARITLGSGGLFHAVALVGITALALVWKETATFLILHLAMVATIVAWRVGRGLRVAWQALLLAVGLATLTAIGAVMPSLLAVFGSTYNIGPGVHKALGDPLAFAAAVVGDVLPQLWGMLVSSWSVLGNFGGTPVGPVPSATVVAVMTVAAAFVGWCLRLVDPPNASQPRNVALALVWSASALLCLLQPSTRQVLADTQDVHQGRWLFTLAAPAAVVIAAGIVRLRPVSGWVALPGVLWLYVMWATLGHIGQWYYERIPDLVARAHVFTRGSGGADVGDARVYALIGELARQQGAAAFWCQATLLLVASSALLWFLFSSRDVCHQDRPTPPR